MVVTAITAAEADGSASLSLWHKVDLYVFVAITDYASFEDFVRLGVVLFSSKHKGLAKQWDSFRPQLGDYSRTLKDHVFEFQYLNMLLHNGIRVRDVKTVYESLLHDACKEGQEQIVQYLLDGGQDVNSQDEDKDTALIWASENGHRGMVELLLGVDGIDVNQQGYYKRTALICASRGGDKEIVGLLLHVDDINVNEQGHENDTALIYSSQQGHIEVVELLLCMADIDVNLQGQYRCVIDWRVLFSLGLNGYISILLMSYFMCSGALDSSSVLLSYHIIYYSITIKHMTIILIYLPS